MNSLKKARFWTISHEFKKPHNAFKTLVKHKIGSNILINTFWKVSIFSFAWFIVMLNNMILSNNCIILYCSPLLMYFQCSLSTQNWLLYSDVGITSFYITFKNNASKDFLAIKVRCLGASIQFLLDIPRKKTWISSLYCS